MYSSLNSNRFILIVLVIRVEGLGFEVWGFEHERFCGSSRISVFSGALEGGASITHKYISVVV